MHHPAHYTYPRGASRVGYSSRLHKIAGSEGCTEALIALLEEGVDQKAHFKFEISSVLLYILS